MLDDNPDVAYRFPVVKPHALELIDRHGPIPPSRVGDQNSIPHDAAKNDEVIVAQGVDCHHERRPLYQVVQIELTQTLTRIKTRDAIALIVSLAIVVRNPLTN